MDRYAPSESQVCDGELKNPLIFEATKKLEADLKNQGIQERGSVTADFLVAQSWAQRYS